MVAFLMGCVLAIGAVDDRVVTGPVVPLIHAHAHNDYEHKRPLFDRENPWWCLIGWLTRPRLTCFSTAVIR